MHNMAFWYNYRMKLQTLKTIYRELNRDVFSGVLSEPVILSRRWRDAIGQHSHTGRYSIMEFNPRGITGIHHARSVIFHECIHQYISEVLDYTECDDHGPAFFAWCDYFAVPGIEIGDTL